MFHARDWTCTECLTPNEVTDLHHFAVRGQWRCQACGEFNREVADDHEWARRKIIARSRHMSPRDLRERLARVAA